jgi:Tfp pilus assembly protein PilE
MRPCRIDAAALQEADAWLEEYRRLWEQRLDRLDDYLRVLQADQAKGAQAALEAKAAGTKATKTKATTAKAPKAEETKRGRKQ